VTDQDSDEIAKLASFTGHLKHAALLRGDDLDEAYLAGITKASCLPIFCSMPEASS
jgi:hypothetical protein